MKLRSFFKDHNAPTDEAGDTSLRSTFTPPQESVPVEILTFEKAILNEMDSLNIDTIKPFNMTRKDHEALNELKQSADNYQTSR